MRIRLALAFLVMSVSICHEADAATCRKKISTAKEFQRAFVGHERCSWEVNGLVGRVLRGKSDADFTSLSDNSERRLIFLMGADGLGKIIGLETKKILQQIGYPNAYIDDLIKQKIQFKLVVFKPTDDQPLADWDHTLELTEQVYPAVAAKIKAQTANLKKHSFETIQALGPEKLSVLSKSGSLNANFIDLKKLESRGGSEWEVRAFLFNVVYLNELYSGKGKSRSEDGKETTLEYISRNRELSKLKDAALINLPY